MNLNILALDLGTKAGWSRLNIDRISSGSVSFQPARGSGAGTRFLMFRRWLNDSIRLSGKPDAIYYEQVERHLGVYAAHIYGGYLATLMGWCEDKGIHYEGVNVRVIKKHATGKGNASKAQMIEATKRYPEVDANHPIKDDNEADARHLLDYALKEFHGISGAQSNACGCG